MASRDDRGQVILLAGILLVLAFILFSVQLSLLANIGQQAGREAQTPLVDDYLLVRRTFETQLKDELTNATGQVNCPDLTEFRLRVNATLGLLRALEENRAQVLNWTLLAVTAPLPTEVDVQLWLALSNESATVADRILFKVTCVV